MRSSILRSAVSSTPTLPLLTALGKHTANQRDDQNSNEWDTVHLFEVYSVVRRHCVESMHRGLVCPKSGLSFTPSCSPTDSHSDMT